jgi:hypothetical protein
MLAIVVKMYWNPIDVEAIKQKVVLRDARGGWWNAGAEHVIKDAKTRLASRFTFVNLGYLGQSKSQQQHFRILALPCCLGRKIVPMDRSGHVYGIQSS